MDKKCKVATLTLSCRIQCSQHTFEVFMNPILGIFFIVAIIIGVSEALKENRDFYRGKSKGIKSSKSLFNYLFTDYN